VDYVAVREANEEAIGIMANAFGETLGEKAKTMPIRLLAGALVTSVWNAGRFYSDKVTEALALTTKLRNDDAMKAPRAYGVSRARRNAPAVSPPR
jgi:hypothetical protein